ncbi:hypothetical protein ABZY02_35475 [Streptomyces sp. NPDC006649]|uniref:hypothetical protein n=1 Tax=Streptomyces sp. NPDC006649 TaxID=3156896 RepID=UPI0033BC6778
MTFLFNRRHAPTVIRDVDVACTQIEQALTDADASLRPGLDYALGILRRLPSSEAEVEKEWATTVWAAAGIDPSQEVRAIKALRDAKPGLPLVTAVEIAKRATQ